MRYKRKLKRAGLSCAAGIITLVALHTGTAGAETSSQNSDIYQTVGCGIREVVTADVYRVELAARTTGAPTMMAMRDETTPSRLRIQVSPDITLPDEPPSSWVTRLDPKLNDKDMAAFDTIFARIDAGDVMTVFFTPRRGTRVLLNGDQVLQRDGKHLMHVLVDLWAGNNPLSESLKEDILNPNEDCVFD